jgi:hypothetical protein
VRTYKILLLVTSCIAVGAFILDRLTQVGQEKEGPPEMFRCHRCGLHLPVTKSLQDPRYSMEERVCGRCYKETHRDRRRR